MADDEFPIARQIMPLHEDDEVVTAVPMAGVYIVAYADETGEISTKWHLEGEPNFHEIMGMVEMFKMRAVANAYGWDPS